MALALTLDLAKIGVPATYWRILSWSLDRTAGTATYSIAGYVSQAMAEQGAEPLPGCTLVGTASLAALGVATLDEVTRSHLYAHAKRSTAPVTCTQDMIDSGHYAAELLGELVMPEAAPNLLAAAADA